MLAQFVCILKFSLKQGFSPVSRHEFSVLIELTLGHLRVSSTQIDSQERQPWIQNPLRGATPPKSLNKVRLSQARRVVFPR